MATEVAASLRELCRQLEDCPSLRPGPQVDALFERLVRIVVTTPADRVAAVLDDPVTQALRPRLLDLCARGEQHLELAWAERVAASAAPHEELSRFPYLDNYRQLSRMELDLLASVAPGPIRRVAFVGCGPLPLTALLGASQLAAPVDCIDRDPAALWAARRVAAALSAERLRFRRAAAGHVDLSSYDLVVLAALVGRSPADKRALLARLSRAMTPGGLLLARGARGLRTLLYPEVTAVAAAGFEPLAVVHPVGEVINSALLLRARGSG